MKKFLIMVIVMLLISFYPSHSNNSRKEVKHDIIESAVKKSERLLYNVNKYKG